MFVGIPFARNRLPSDAAFPIIGMTIALAAIGCGSLLFIDRLPLPERLRLRLPGRLLTLVAYSSCHQHAAGRGRPGLRHWSSPLMHLRCAAASRTHLAMRCSFLTCLQSYLSQFLRQFCLFRLMAGAYARAP